jgi:hypothetical protein
MKFSKDEKHMIIEYANLGDCIVNIGSTCFSQHSLTTLSTSCDLKSCNRRGFTYSIDDTNKYVDFIRNCDSNKTELFEIFNSTNEYAQMTEDLSEFIGINRPNYIWVDNIYLYSLMMDSVSRNQRFVGYLERGQIFGKLPFEFEKEEIVEHYIPIELSLLKSKQFMCYLNEQSGLSNDVVTRLWNQSLREQSLTNINSLVV